MKLEQIRCQGETCNKRLLDHMVLEGTIRIKCPNCGTMNSIIISHLDRESYDKVVSDRQRKITGGTEIKGYP